MSDQGFSWTEFSSPNYGEAGEVPAVLAEARTAGSEDEVLDLVEPILRFVLDAGVLNDAAVHMATTLLDEVSVAVEEGRPAAPYLAILGKLFEPHAYRRDIPGWTPRESITTSLHWTSGHKVRFVVEQRRHLAQVRESVAARGELLRRIANGELPADRVHAVAVLHVAECLSRATDEAWLVNTANSLSTEGHVASLMLPCAALCSANEAPSLSSWLQSFLDSGSPYLRGAAWTAWHDFGLSRSRAVGLADLEELLEAGDRPNPDYVWHDGLLAGELCRAVFRAELPGADKSSLLAAALHRRSESHSELLVAPSVASSAAWFFLRLHLSAHYRRTTPLDPHELSHDERDAIRLLHATSRNWLPLGADYPNVFGLWNFASTAAQLIEPSPGLAMLLGDPWPYESRESSVLGWLQRCLAFPRQSAERRAAFELLAQQLVQDLDDARLREVLGEIRSFDASTGRELALPALAHLVRRLQRGIPDAAAADAGALLDQLASTASAELAATLRTLLDR